MDKKKRPRKNNKSYKESKQMHAQNAEKMKKAVLSVINNNTAIREAAQQLWVSKSALQRYIVKYKSADEEHRANFSFERHHGFCQIFSNDEEQLLSEYLITASNMC